MPNIFAEVSCYHEEARSIQADTGRASNCFFNWNQLYNKKYHRFCRIDNYTIKGKVLLSWYKWGC